MLARHATRRLNVPTAVVAAASTCLLVAACGSPHGATPGRGEMPVYPSAELVERVEEAGRDPTSTYLVRDARATVVLAWYRDEMPRRGWTPTSDIEDDVVFYRDGQGCYSFVMASDREDGTGVFLQVSRQREGSDCAYYTAPPPGNE